MGIKRLTYDAKGKHFCDYSTRDIINRLAECEIMLDKIEQIYSDYLKYMNPNNLADRIGEVIEDGKID